MKHHALRHSEVLPPDMPIPIPLYGCFDDPADSTTKAYRKILEQDKRRRLFAYTSIVDDRYGTLQDDTKENLDAFFKGRDEKAYDDLVAAVNKNHLSRRNPKNS